MGVGTGLYMYDVVVKSLGSLSHLISWWVLVIIFRLHDTTGCPTGCRTGHPTGCTTGWMFVYTTPPVVQPVVASCIHKHSTGCPSGCSTDLTNGCIV